MWFCTQIRLSCDLYSRKKLQIYTVSQSYWPLRTHEIQSSIFVEEELSRNHLPAFPSPQLCFNYLLRIETNPQTTQSNSFWFQNLDWYFLFFKNLYFLILCLCLLLNVGNLGIEEKIRIIAQRWQFHRYRSQNLIVLFFLDNIFEVQLLRNHESLSTGCSLLCYDRDRMRNTGCCPGRPFLRWSKQAMWPLAMWQKFCFREHPE